MTKILVVDDEKSLRTVYQQHLSDAGFEVLVAESGPQAVEMVRQEKPDLVVLDIAMPGMDGIETLEKLLGGDKSLPVILYSAYSHYKDSFRTWAADAYVVKSGDPQELIAKIEQVLAEREAAGDTSPA